MQIHPVDFRRVSFLDVDGQPCPIPGIALSSRARYRTARAELDTLLASTRKEHPLHLWNTDPGFQGLVKELLSLAGIDWQRVVDARNRQQIIWGVVLPYEKDGSLYQGVLDELEFAPTELWARGEKPQPDGSAPPEVPSYDALWLDLLDGTERLLNPLPLAQHRLFEGWLNLLQGYSGDLRAVYDSDPTFCRVLHNLLSLWDISPAQVSFSMAAQLILSPGYLMRLQFPSEKPDGDAKPLPQDESPTDALLSLMSIEGMGPDWLRLPYPQLRAVMKSRGRLLREARGDSKVKAEEPPDKVKALLEKMKQGALWRRPAKVGAVLGHANEVKKVD